MLKKFTIPAFILMVAIQVIIPARIIQEKEKVIREGREFRFRINSVLPLIMGQNNSILLYYADNQYIVEDDSMWVRDEPVYVTLANDAEGFAIINNIYKSVPEFEEDYVLAHIDYAVPDTHDYVMIRFPFDRFYLDRPIDPSWGYYIPPADSIAPVTSVAVRISEGQGVVQNVFVDGVPLAEYLTKMSATKPQ
jgi:hypothetical protein